MTPPSSSDLSHAHSPDAIRARLARGPSHSYLRDFVYGGIDGAVTTFAVVSGVVGASLSVRTILVLGVANLVADGFSMAASNYLGTSSERDELRRLSAFEARQIELDPSGESEEVRQILSRNGLEGETLEKAVTAFTSDKKRWIDLMLAEEYGLPREVRSAWKAAACTFASFVLMGALPLLPYSIGLSAPFGWATALTATAFFSVGALKSRWSLASWWSSGLTTLAVGAAAAGIAYAVGAAFGSA